MANMFMKVLSYHPEFSGSLDRHGSFDPRHLSIITTRTPSSTGTYSSDASSEDSVSSSSSQSSFGQDSYSSFDLSCRSSASPSPCPSFSSGVCSLDSFNSPDGSVRSGSPVPTVTASVKSQGSSSSSSLLSRKEDTKPNREKVKLLVRMRPFFEKEKVCPYRQVLCLLGNRILIKQHPSTLKTKRTCMSKKKFDELELEVDYVQDDSYVQVKKEDKKEESQRHLFSTIGVQAVDRLLNGQSVTILSYGQAGTGKTYTIYGDGTESGRGLIPRITCDFLHKIQAKGRDDECVVEVSFLEIYQEKLRDLLAVNRARETPFELLMRRSPDLSTEYPEVSSSSDQDSDSDSDSGPSLGFRDIPDKVHVHRYQQGTKSSIRHPVRPTSNYLKLREHPVKGTYVEGLIWKKVCTWSDMDRLLKQGAARRSTVATDSNRQSSRSHTLFTMKVTWLSTPRHGGRTVSYLNLVDLAGNEKLQNVSIEKQKDMKYINKSLSQLNSVILNLSRSTFVPYRNSALTWLLKESLQGDNITFLVANVSPAEKDFNETLATLNYAFKAKRIHNFQPAPNSTNSSSNHSNKDADNSKKNTRRRIVYKMNEEICSISSLLNSMNREQGKY
uniref:Kinesin OrphI protein n=1 Tax=Marsilea vestita TaxID=59764 RepID=A0A142KWD7_MARVE|nr:kinesin OrphI protein [Marsilea vestita]